MKDIQRRNFVVGAGAATGLVLFGISPRPARRAGQAGLEERADRRRRAELLRHRRARSR
jgi:hypothetical protein